MMQKYPGPSGPDERRVVRKWHLRMFAFYGSIVAVLLLLSAISDKSTERAARPELPTAAAVSASR